MKTEAIYIMFVMLCAIGMAAPENPNVGTSFRSANTVPSQDQQRRLLTSPNPLSASSNDVVTGNVSGLRHFRGVVPYGSQYYTSTDLTDVGTESISSFLRRSNDPVLSDRNPAQTRVYYEPRRTVSSFYVQGGQQTALSESIARAQPRRSPVALPNLTTSVQDDFLQRPLSTSGDELDRILSRHLELKEQAQEAARDSILESQNTFENFFEIVLKPETVEPPQAEKLVTEQPLREPLQEPTVEEQPQIEERRLDEMPTEPEMTLPEVPIRQEFLEEEPPAEPREGEPGEQPQTAEQETARDDLQERIDQSAEARRIRGDYKTLAGLTGAKLADYMQAAEEFLRDGKFYKAADAYSLAALWVTDDPRPYAGQAFALFAAGEYMSSAYYLSRAIEMDPALAAKKYDLAALIGDRDVFENRLIEMATWQERSQSGELAFLMAYVLYHDGKTAQAAEALRKAQTQMPDNPAVAILKNVISPENGTAPR